MHENVTSELLKHHGPDMSTFSDVGECSSQEIKENLSTLEQEQHEAKSQSDVKAARKARLLRRLALAGNGNMAEPGSIHSSGDVDLSTEDDRRDPALEAFAAKIGSLLPKRKPETSTSPRNKSAGGFAAFRKEKSRISNQLSIKRRIDQEKRREIYLADNEDVLGENEEEEPQDEDTEKTEEQERKERRERVQQRLAREAKKEVENDSDNDSDYNGDEEEGGSHSGSEESDGEEEDKEGNGDDDAEGTEFPGEPDSIMAKEGEQRTSGDDDGSSSSMFDNNKEKDEDEEESVFLAPSIEDFPATLSQWFGETAVKEEANMFTVPGMEATVSQLPKGAADDELMMLCSGVFAEEEGGATQMTRFATTVVRETQFTRVGSDDEEERAEPVRTAKKVLIDEDDEPETETGETVGASEEAVDEKVLDEGDGSLEMDDKLSNLMVEDTVRQNRTKHAVIDDSDEEEAADKDTLGQDDGEEEENEEDQFEDEEDVEEEEEVEVEEPLPTLPADADSDDELAIYKDLEHRSMLRKKGFVDEQAELSGDDVGSDDDEEGEENEYEQELGDEDAIDVDEVRNQNNKLYLKQMVDEDSKAIRGMQNVFFADGDLAGVETNRKFRYALRDEADAVAEEGGEGEEEKEEDGEGADEESEQAHRERIEAIKYRMQHDEEEKPEAPVEVEKDSLSSVFDMIGDTVSKNPTKSRAIPSLLANKDFLARSVKDSTGNVPAPKQLYVQQAKESEVGGVNRGGGAQGGGVKRQSEGAGLEAKRARNSVFSKLQ